MDRRTFIGLALAPLLPAPRAWSAHGAMVGYADLSNVVTRISDCASVSGYIYGIRRTGELVFTVNYPPSEDLVSRGAESTAGPAAFWR